MIRSTININKQKRIRTKDFRTLMKELSETISSAGEANINFDNFKESVEKLISYIETSVESGNYPVYMRDEIDVFIDNTRDYLEYINTTDILQEIWVAYARYQDQNLNG